MLKKRIFFVAVLMSAVFAGLSQKAGFNGDTAYASSANNKTSSGNILSLSPQLSLDAQITNISLRDSDTIEMNDSERVEVTVKNTGTAIWQKGTVYLFTEVQRAPSGSRDAAIIAPHIPATNKDVKPGESYKFTYEIDGPKTVGEYTIKWRMKHQREGEFGKDATRKIKVIYE